VRVSRACAKLHDHRRPARVFWPALAGSGLRSGDGRAPGAEAARRSADRRRGEAMNLWDRIKSFKVQNAQQLVYGRIPPERTDVPAGPVIGAYQGYFRIFLADMFLSQSRQWFTDQFPCVTASV